MTSPAGEQLDFLGRLEPEAAELTRPSSSPSTLGLTLSQKSWLLFLGSEWLSPNESGQILLGKDCLVGGPGEGEGPPVAVWFDLDKLPQVAVRAYAEGRWESSELHSLKGAHCAVLWNGPLPLFAVHHFSVESAEEKRHLYGLASSFRDIEPPQAESILVERIPPVVPVESGEHPALTGTMHPPANWNALRGAASMAAWAVPAIDPWLDLMCESLGGAGECPSAEVVHAAWWRRALWTCHPNLVSDDPLWTAILTELGNTRGAKKLRPREALENICVRATTLGADKARVDHLRSSTQRLLDDQTTVQTAGVVTDVLGVSLQLLLLRPTPDRFIGWREDWPSMPPGAWWTGATLCGFLTGFRGLPRDFRGTPEARRILALRTWRFGCGGDTGLWDSVAREKLDWTQEGDWIHLRSDGVVWATHKISRRGRWYRVNFEDKAAREALEPVVASGRMELMTTHLVLKEGRVAFSSKSGKGTVSVRKKDKEIVIKEGIEIELGEGAFIERRFSADRVKDWLATASISEPLPKPDFAALNVTDSHQRRPARELGEGAKVSERGASKPKAAASPKPARKTAVVASEPPAGLKLHRHFLSEDEERSLLDIIDHERWDTGMKRRVQHYGWRYDYANRKVTPSARIGPLPGWLAELADRLVAKGIFTETPDQVIVNEYVGDQGISKHVDCVPCFRGPIVTISLNEDWEMLFVKKTPKMSAPKFGQILERRSAAVLDGEARLDWTHEIPERKNEASGPRGRRVSVTFRKVNA
ncbi:MAG: alpha-ketoglutarate-dependent dioxygenase AlkB [Pseudomonadota bacterium]|nr:alpha-ketoglutarate-dependent dioxygenase AlkB [Pseudomonadota bacterium]